MAIVQKSRLPLCGLNRIHGHVTSCDDLHSIVNMWGIEMLHVAF